jgi:peptide/nickel transport system substrate-binding protein
VTALLPFGCIGGDDQPGGSAAEGGTLAVGFTEPPDALDPALASTPRSREALWLVYTPPLTYAHAEGKRGTALVPGLAERLPRVSADGRTYSFRFRRGLTYSSGRRLRASDFEHTIARARALSVRARRFYRGIKRITSDDRTRRVTIELRAPEPNFPDVLALISSGVVPRGTPLRDMSARPPHGVGPYAIARTSPDGGFLMRRRRTLELAGIPEGKVDEIVVRIMSRADQGRAVIDGRLDYMQGPPPADLLPVVRSDYADRYEEHPTASTSWFDLPVRRPPFDDERVRQAAALAVDREELQRLHGGLLEPACNFLPSAIAGYEKLEPCPHGDRSGEPSLERARALVEEAGAEGAAVVVVPGKGESGARVARYWARTLLTIGLNVRRGARARGATTGPRTWSGEIAHPAAVFNSLRGRDAALDAEIGAVARQRVLAHAEPEWAEIDRRVVEDALAVPFGSERRSTFMSERLDLENCSLFHPVYGNDYSSFCLR